MTVINKLEKVFMAAAVSAALMLCITGCDNDDSREPTTLETVQTSSAETISSGTVNRGSESEVHDIGRHKVIAIALGKVPGATEADICELEYEYEQGRIEYEGEILYGGYEYSFEIDGSTGNILKWDVER